MFENLLPDKYKEYKKYILLDIEEELSSENDNDYIALGFEEDGIMKGAVVSLLEEDGNILILSLMVDENYRRCGIATQLLDETLSIASQLIEYKADEDEIVIDLKCSYCLTPDETDIFEAFLKAFGFCYIYNKEKVACIDGTDIFGNYVFSQEAVKEYIDKYSDKIIPLINSSKEDKEELVYITNGLPTLEYCFATGEADGRRAMFLVEQTEENKPVFWVYLAKHSQTCPMDEFLAVVYKGICAIRLDYGTDFTLALDTNLEDTSDLLNLFGNKIETSLYSHIAIAEVTFARNDSI